MFDFIFQKLGAPKHQKYLMVLVLLTLFALILFLNHIYPNAEDDWYYTFVWRPEAIDLMGRRITSFNDLFDSQYAHYMQWGGRTVAHIIAQLILCLDTDWQDVLNSFAFLAMMYLIYRYSNWGNKTRVSVFLLGCALFWFTQPIICSTVLWITGSANYLWTSLILLSFIYYYYALYMKEGSNNGALRSVLFFFFGIVAGWTNENMVVAAIFFIIILFLILKKRNIKIPAWAYTGLIGLTIGALFLILAPGNMVRVNATCLGEPAFSIDSLIHRGDAMFDYYLKYLLILSVISIAAILYFFKKGNTHQKEKVAPMLLLLFISAHVAFIAMLSTPYFPERAMFGLITLLVIVINIAYANLDIEKRVIQIGAIAVLSVAIIAFAIDYRHKCNRIYTIYHTLKEREAIIEKGKKAGIKDFIFDNQLIISKKYHFYDCQQDPKSGKNIAYSYYYGINSMSVIDRASKDTTGIGRLIILKQKQDSIIEAYGK